MLLLILISVVVLDQTSKYAAVKHLKGNSPHVIIKDFFQLHYVENFGAAFGILQNRKMFFIIVSSIVIIGILFFIFKGSYNLNRLMEISLIIFLGGAIGNLIDRIRLGYVIDFLSFRLGSGYDFPVFNIADISIVISTFLIMAMVLMDRYEI
ncbi:MAG: signal peptidase II [Tissierellia bacterium]|mgnify:CR=1 FL=1|nr:signal peptidase II [Tissierellia bacterium]